MWQYFSHQECTIVMRLLSTNETPYVPELKENGPLPLKNV